MSSIGGQGMNTGFADAQLAARSLLAAMAEPATAEAILARYDAVRRKAYRIAADRAERGMRLGTARGRVWSALRTWIIRDLLFGPWMAKRLAAYFAMLTIPANPPIG
jgi:2-polyprenyl-6-methoxyphenol hydroxylase-like FAD-dependent oxidoreductase